MIYKIKEELVNVKGNLDKNRHIIHEFERIINNAENALNKVKDYIIIY